MITAEWTWLEQRYERKEAAPLRDDMDQMISENYTWWITSREKAPSLRRIVVVASLSGLQQQKLYGEWALDLGRTGIIPILCRKQKQEAEGLFLPALIQDLHGASLCGDYVMLITPPRISERTNLSGNILYPICLLILLVCVCIVLWLIVNVTHNFGLMMERNWCQLLIADHANQWKPFLLEAAQRYKGKSGQTKIVP